MACRPFARCQLFGGIHVQSVIGRMVLLWVLLLLGLLPYAVGDIAEQHVEPFSDYLNRSNPIPIEALKPLWVTKGDLLLQQRLPNHIDISKAPLRVFLNFGARSYESSTAWFLRFYPQADTMKFKAWEIMQKYWASYDDHPEVELHKEAVWVSNGTMTFVNPDMATPSHFSSQMAKNLVGSAFKIPTVDISDYLARNFRRSDFVVCKMDIEGAEYTVVPHLIKQKTITLIDELFFGPHPQLQKTKAGKNRGLQMIRKIRSMGVYAHQWL